MSQRHKEREFSALEKETKAIYIEQHKAYIRDRSIFDRFYQVAVDPSSYGVGKDFFSGKHILDAGCGNTAYFQKAMFDLGASHITCLDIGDGWMPELDSALQMLGVPKSFYTMVSGSTTDLPFETGDFDFVASNGVLMHLEGKDQAEQAFSELGRVTRKGGSLYAYVGISQPGIVDRYIVPSLRAAYKEDQVFKQFVDTITPETLQKDLSRYVEAARLHDDSINTDSLREFVSLFTLDTCTFLQNMLQVPMQQGAALGLEWGMEQFDSNGFSNVRRIPTKYWKRNDVRKFLAPVHFDADNAITTLFYGNGHIKLVGDKPE